jgi:hypothetical protein
MASPSKGRRRKPKVVVELPQEMRDEDEDVTTGRCNRFLIPFVLGFNVALSLILVPSIASIYSVCQEASANATCPAMVVPALVPVPSPVPPPKPKGLKRLFQRKNNNIKTQEATMIAPQPAPQDPTACACQLFWQALDRLGMDVQDKLMGGECARSEQQQALLLSSQPDPALKQEFLSAFTPEKIEIPSQHQALITDLTEKMRAFVPDWDERARQVSWGGPGGPAWFQLAVDSPETDLEALGGGSLMYSYLRIMHWPHDLYVHFPFKLCAKGCNAEVALSHSLEYREKYQPWIVSPGIRKENAKGCIYHRGFSPSLTDDSMAQHAIVWIRPGLRNKSDDVAYTRTYANILDRAVAASLERSEGRLGKFNIVVDGSEFSWGLVPSLHDTKVFVTMLQDHFPDRLGIVLFSNLGRIGEFVLKLFLPLITEEVRNKLKVLPHGAEKRRHVLETVLGADNIPDWMGGKDTYQFQVDEYYSNKELYATDEQANEYLTTMPYHT